MMRAIARRLRIHACVVLCGLLFLCTAIYPGVSHSMREHLEPFRVNAVPESALNAMLHQFCDSSEYVEVAIGLADDEEDCGCVPLRISEYSFENLAARHNPSRVRSCVVYTESRWRAAARLLAERADHLASSTDTYLDAKRKVRARILLYHFPHQVPLGIGTKPVFLSKQAQRYIILQKVSDYPASTKILIIGEPHYDVSAQLALYNGLTVFFTDNPSLTRDGRAVFLAEGWPADKPFSVRPLVEAEAKPSDGIIRRILGTFLIPGYVAYEWKNQQGIPIAGIEDSRLYRLSGQFWAELQNGQNGARSILWRNTVAARNRSIVLTLLDQLKRHECPILFVGSLHLDPLTDQEMLGVQDWERFRDVAESSELQYLQRSQKRSIEGLLWDRGIGFYLLAAKGDPMPDRKLQEQQTSQYARLFRAQLRNELNSYVRELTAKKLPGVTVSPAPEAAARIVRAASRGNGESGDRDGGGNNKDGDQGGDWRARFQDWLEKLGNALRSAGKVPQKARQLMQYLMKHGRQPDGYEGGKTFRNLEGRLPQGGDYHEYDVNRVKPGKPRGPERIVVDQSGKPWKAWYTPDHYQTFIPIH